MGHSSGAVPVPELHPLTRPLPITDGLRTLWMRLGSLPAWSETRAGGWAWKGFVDWRKWENSDASPSPPTFPFLAPKLTLLGWRHGSQHLVTRFLGVTAAGCEHS